MCSLRLVAQDIALSRRKQGFESPRERQTEPQLVIAISSRALFDLDESHQVFEHRGLETYRDYQIEKEDTPLDPGNGFYLARKLLAINQQLDAPGRVEVILLSRNTADTGLRVFNSIEHHKLGITRAAFCGGLSPHRYVSAFGVHLFLSNVAEDVRRALQEGVAAATLLGGPPQHNNNHEIRFAFDGDAVLFSDQAEQVYQKDGLEAFTRSESESADQPLDGGPFKPFLTELHRLQKEFDPELCPIRTALITARAAPAHKRVIKTLRHWNIRLDESLFLGGQRKSQFLKAYGADVFFDDQQQHCDDAGVTAAHVPHGIINR